MRRIDSIGDNQAGTSLAKQGEGKAKQGSDWRGAAKAKPGGAVLGVESSCVAKEQHRLASEKSRNV